MNDFDTSEVRRQTIDEAAVWWVLLQSSEVSRQQREDFVCWLRESPIHVTEMLRMAGTHGVVEQFVGWETIDVRKEDETVVSLPSAHGHALAAASSASDGLPLLGSRHRWRLGAAAIAAILLAVAISFTGFFAATGPQRFATETGERRAVTLSDGSVLQMDPQTQVRVRYEKQIRRVTLERGRVLFRVARDAGKPFVVDSFGISARAVGTVFAVEHDSASTVVTVAEGKVALSAGDLESATSTRPLTLRETATAGLLLRSNDMTETKVPSLFLIANQQATVADIGAVTTVHDVDSAAELAWAEGRLIFNNQTVSDVVRAFNRYNRVQISVTDAGLASRRLSGAFVGSDPDSFVSFLQAVTNVRVLRDDTQRIILSSPSH